MRDWCRYTGRRRSYMGHLYPLVGRDRSVQVNVTSPASNNAGTIVITEVWAKVPPCEFPVTKNDPEHEVDVLPRDDGGALPREGHLGQRHVDEGVFRPAVETRSFTAPAEDRVEHSQPVPVTRRLLEDEHDMATKEGSADSLLEVSPPRPELAPHEGIKGAGSPPLARRPTTPCLRSPWATPSQSGHASAGIPG